jgi:hypothetical protein
VSGGSQFSVDDGRALVHKLNEPSSIIIQREFQLSSLDWTVVDTIRATQDQDDPIIMDDVDSIREVLSGHTIDLYKLHDENGIFAQVDAFVNLSRENETVEEVHLTPFNDPGDDASGTHRYAIWDKIAEGIGNLQALREITIFHTRSVDDEGEDLVPDWEILACILRRLQRGIRLCMDDFAPLWDHTVLPVFYGVIQGQAMITGFSTSDGFYFDGLDVLCSALLTLPALENVSFEHFRGEGPEEGQSLESMVKLLLSPTLREVTFKFVVFTNTLCQAVAKVLKERSEITDLHFLYCDFPDGGNSMTASALKTNTTLKCLDFDVGADEVFYEVLAAPLLSNCTLQNLSFDCSGSCSWLSPLFLALEVNVGLKKLYIFGINLIDEKLSTAMRLGLRKNSTLELLELSIIKSGDHETCLWREAFSFLRTNTALKTLDMIFEHDVTESHATAIRMEVLAMLSENESLETLSMVSDTRFEDYLVLVAAIQPNTTLKSLQLQQFFGEDFCVDEDETKDLIPVLKKNYGLEAIPGLHHGAGDVNSIFELNQAGRRYLVQDGFSISKGVDVLGGVSNNINSVFLHLLENPRLCDRSAVEMSSIIGNIDNAGSTSRGHHSGGKREQQTPSHTGKEPRRRLL